VADVFRIDVVVSNRQAVSGVRQVESSLEDLNRTAASTNRLLRNAFQLVGLGAGIEAARRLVGALTDLSDTYTQIQNRLGSVTEGTEELESATASLLGVANRTRTSFEATAQLYARTALATRDLGTSQADLLGITETVNQAIILSGASAKESSNGLIQLSQAISSNRLAGDELRSVLEQLPVVADVIARQLGVTRGQLRELGRDGEITAQVILDAFQGAREEISQRFAKTVPTASQALQVLQNNAVRFVGELNKATGASQLLAAVLGLLGRSLDVLALSLVAVGAALAAGPFVRFAQRLADAAAAQRLFNAEVAAGIAGPEAAALALENEARAAVLASEADLAKTRAAISVTQAEQARAVAVAEASEATFAGLSATLRASQADIRRAESAAAVAEAEIVRARAEGVVAERETFLFGLEQQLAALETARAGAVERLAAAEAQLAAASAAAARAQEGRVIASAQMAALDAQLTAQTDALAAAQARLNGTLRTTPGLLAKIGAFIAANPFGVAVAAIGALLILLTDFSAVTEGVSSVLRSVGDGLDLVRGAATSALGALGGVGEVLSTLIRLATAAGLALVAIKVAAASAGVAIAASLGAALLVLGEIARRLDQVNEALVRQGIALAENSFAERLRRASEEVARLKEIAEREGGDSSAARRLVSAEEKLAALQRERLRNARALRDEDPLKREIAEQQEIIDALGKSRRERELELDLIRRRKALSREGVDVDAGSPNEARLRAILAARQAAEELAAVVDDIKGPEDDFRRKFDLLVEAEDRALISARDLSGALNKLFAERRDAQPLIAAIDRLQDAADAVVGPTLALTGDPGRDLETIQKANREFEIQVRLQQELKALRDAGVATEDISARRGQIEALLREAEASQRLREQQERLLEIQRERADASRLSLLPEFDQAVERQILALRELNDVVKDPAAEAAAIRRNELAREFGALLNNLQSPALAQAQAQQQIAAETQRANEAFNAGVLSAGQLALVLQDLDFKAREASTAFGDGFTVALDRMSASVTEATIGSQTLTAALNAATQATSQLVQDGSVDIRRLALNFIDAIAQIITQLLVLRAVKALAGLGGGATDAISGIAGVLPGVAIPGLAGGGRTEPGQPYVVGENGPELRVFSRPGSIVPSDQVVEALGRAGAAPAAQAAAPQVTVPVTIVNQTDPNEFGDYLSSDAAGRHIVNQVTKNPEKIRRGLGR